MDEVENTDLYNYYGMNITQPDSVAFINPWSLAMVTFLLVILVFYLNISSKLPEELYRCLALEHLASGCLQVTCLTFYNLNFDIELLSDALEEAYSSMDLVITLTTACLSWIIFLRVFLFRNGEKLYSLKQLTIFSTLSMGVIEAYEWLISLVASDPLFPALRLTSVLLIMSVPVVVFMLLLKSLLTPSSEVPKFQALFFMAYLLMFISSDMLLLRFNLHSVSSCSLLSSIFLYLRLGVETVLYIVFDRYMSHFFLN